MLVIRSAAQCGNFRNVSMLICLNASQKYNMACHIAFNDCISYLVGEAVILFLAYFFLLLFLEEWSDCSGLLGYHIAPLGTSGPLVLSCICFGVLSLLLSM